MDNTFSSVSINFVLLDQAINRYIPIPLLFVGVIGNILNILVFTHKTFRNNICATYFLASTIFDSHVIIIGLLPRLLYGFGIDPSQSSVVLCKVRFFITYFAGCTAAWFISLACVERYLSSSISANRRKLITMKRAYLSMVVVILIGFIVFGEEFYCIDINQQLLGAPQSCYQRQANVQCQIVDSLMQFLFATLTPALMMIVFGFLTLRNIRQKHRRTNAVQTANTTIPKVPMTIACHFSAQQQSTNITTDSNSRSVLTRVNRTTRKRDAQLITMLLVQVAVFVISSFPISGYKLYAAATIYETKSNLRKSIENTIFNMSAISLFLNNTITFYIYTLCGDNKVIPAGF
ncbi:unnamed protein product [Rotaria sp. Silwood1]|nr:unnamed protein product [Rotaria sp. Silwood1]CAF1670806.1 unnamed protein product [Rotaria sp. Silwood1]